jgi:putative autoinducer-2 (AI-2) aldolase
MCYNAIQQGASGVDMGRNIFQSDSPISMMQAVRGVVHEGLTPEQGFQMYSDLKAAGTK